MVTTSRRAGRVTNKTKLLVYRGSDKVDLGLAEVIVWENQHDGNSSSSDGNAQPHHVGAKGVESNELLEHHLQAALSSASLIHSRNSNKPASPTPASRSKPDPAASASNASLNYHIPTPDATGLVGSADFSALYQKVLYHEPVNYVRYSETVEESCSGAGGLGYCMDEEDEKWLNAFNAKAEGGSGGAGEVASSPLRETSGHNQPLSAGRERRIKGKEREKERETPLTSLSISEDTFEYVMGMMEKYVEDTIPMLHTDLSKMPQFPAIEHLFSSPVPASFYPAYEVPKGLPDSKSLTRMARNVYPHWRHRREVRKGKSIFPGLNYDEANDGDPYVCFRRRDIRATRKTRRTDNYSVDKFQKLQYELQTAHQIVSMVHQRERQKKTALRLDKELWEAKWKMFETKRKWPSLGISREEEEIITGRSQQQQVQQSRTAEHANFNGAHALHQQSSNVPQIRKRQPDREKDERERRERAIEMARAAEKGVATGGRSMAPESLKERALALKQRLDEAMARRNAANADWDDFTDSSYQPLPRPAADKVFRTQEYLVPNGFVNRDSDNVLRPAAFRLRRGRGGLLRLDRRPALNACQRGKMPSAPGDYSDWLFPDTSSDKEYSTRPKSIDDVEKGEPVDDEDESEREAKRRRLNEIRRYDVDSGGAVGVGMGAGREDDRVVIDDLDAKYIRNRVGLLRSADFRKLQPDMSIIEQTHAALDTPAELPPLPQFIRPEIPLINPMVQQQLLAQQHAERLQAVAAQYAQQQQQQQAYQQQLAAQNQQQMQQGHPQQQQQQQQMRAPSDGSVGHGSPAVNGQGMLPPQTNGRPPISKRPSSQNGTHPNGQGPQQGLPNVAIAQGQAQAQGQGQQGRPAMSPTYPIQMNGSPQLANANAMMLPNGKPLIGPNGQIDPNMQRMLAARLAQQQQQQRQQSEDGSNPNPNPNPAPGNHGITNANAQHVLSQMTPEQAQQITQLAAKGGFGNDIAGFLEHRSKAQQLQKAKQQRDQQAAVLQAQANATAGAGANTGNGAQAQRQPSNGSNSGSGNGDANANAKNNGNGSGSETFASPQLPSGSLNLKLPAHATARLGNKPQPNSPAQRAQ